MNGARRHNNAERLRQATAVAAAWRQFGGYLNPERELLVGRQRFQRAAHGLGNVLNRVIGEFQHELAGLVELVMCGVNP